MAKNFAAMDRRGTQDTLRAMRERVSDKAPRTARLDQLVGNPRNPRYKEDDPKIIETAETLKTVGQLQDIIVVERHVYEAAFPGHESDLGDAVWVVLLGNRRLAAARLAGLSTLNVRVATNLSDADTIKQAILVENLHREGLPPLLEAELLQEMVSGPLGSTRAVGAAIGRSHMYVQQRLQLLDLVPEFKALLKDGGVTVRTARMLGALPRQVQARYLEAGEPYDDLLKLVPSFRTLFNDGELDVGTARALCLRPAAEQQGIFDAGAPFAPMAVNPVSTHEPEDQDAKPSPPLASSDQSAQVVDPPSDRSSVEPTKSTPVVITIRISDPSPEKLAAALREKLSPEQVSGLIHALSQEPGM